MGFLNFFEKRENGMVGIAMKARSGGCVFGCCAEEFVMSRFGGLGGRGQPAEGHGSDWWVQKRHPGRLKMKGELAHLIGGCGAYR